MGHEASGTIAKLGKDVKGNFKIGTARGDGISAALAAAVIIVPNKMAHFLRAGNQLFRLMAEYAVSPRGIVFPLPDDLPLDAGAFLEPASGGRTRAR